MDSTPRQLLGYSIVHYRRRLQGYVGIKFNCVQLNINKGKSHRKCKNASLRSLLLVDLFFSFVLVEEHNEVYLIFDLGVFAHSLHRNYVGFQLGGHSHQPIQGLSHLITCKGTGYRTTSGNKITVSLFLRRQFKLILHALK